jgi:DNA-binding beta-propeller fold protein YncE
MRLLLSCICFFLFIPAFNNAMAGVNQLDNPGFISKVPAAIKTVIHKNTSTPDTIVPGQLKEYSDLIYDKKELLLAAPGTKSVLFNSNGSRLYAMNLEGMSIYEFDQPTRKVVKEFKFKPTKGIGWDYEKDKPISSHQEKPVEACLSHNDKLLWVSLHNAEGIVPIRVDSIDANRNSAKNKQSKKITVIYPQTSEKDSFYVPLIKTGKTPKIISRTADSKYLLVSNWHSYNVSVLETDTTQYPYAKVISTIPVADIPRGIAVDDKNNRSFVAIMGGASIAVINNTVWMKESNMKVASNPRHIVMDTSGRIFVSYNKLGKIACIDANTGNTLFTASTAAQPRTIMLSKNYKFLFATCYSSDSVEVFKINDAGFSRVISLPCKGHPVGVDIFEDDNKLEAWVCSYSNGSITVFNFTKK